MGERACSDCSEKSLGAMTDARAHAARRRCGRKARACLLALPPPRTRGTGRQRGRERGGRVRAKGLDALPFGFPTVTAAAAVHGVGRTDGRTDRCTRRGEEERERERALHSAAQIHAYNHPASKQAERLTRPPPRSPLLSTTTTSSALGTLPSARQSVGRKGGRKEVRGLTRALWCATSAARPDEARCSWPLVSPPPDM